MSFLCALSNRVPTQPVISPVSGCIFEKEVILEHLRENGPTDPTNGLSLEPDQLLDLRKSSSPSGYPVLMCPERDEWAKLLLEKVNRGLKQSKEDFDNQSKPQGAASASAAAGASAAPENGQVPPMMFLADQLVALEPQMDPEPEVVVPPPPPPPEEAVVQEVQEGLTEGVVDRVRTFSEQLIAGRMTRNRQGAPATASTPEAVEGFRLIEQHGNLHGRRQPGITCLDFNQADNIIVTGGYDSSVSVFDYTSKEVIVRMKGHGGKVMQVAHHPTQPILLSGSVDGTGRLWRHPTGECLLTIRAHDETVTGATFHPTGDFAVLSSMDNHWSLVDVETGSILAHQQAGGETGASLTSAKFHPDGLLLTCGTFAGDVQVWDLRQSRIVATFEGHKSPVSSLAFAENGYFYASAEPERSLIIIWDLRKCTRNHDIQMDDEFFVTDMAFDENSRFLAASGNNEVRTFRVGRGWGHLVTFPAHNKLVSGVRFGPDATWLASCSMDGFLKVFGPEQENN